ncbi:IS1 family transposase [Microcoleus sp. C2C6]
MASGKVAIQNLGRLRLAWSWGGKQFWLSIGLPDTKPNRKAAEIKARTIELDLASGNFDPSLTKYKPQKQESISVSDLFDQFVEYKRRKIEPATLAKYLGLQKHVSVFFKNKTCVSVSESVAEKFRDWLGQTQKLEPVTVRELDVYDPEVMPEIGELDELQTYVKKHKIWLWTAVDHFRSGILGWVLGDRSSDETFESLWDRVSAWKCYFYVTDGWPVYPMFIPDEDRIISKTYMTRVEGENTRLRHYLARLHRKTLCYSRCAEMLRHSIKLLIHYLKFQDVPVPAVFIP